MSGPQPARAFGKFPGLTVKVWHPVISQRTYPCEACGAQCYAREDGTRLHPPKARPNPRGDGTEAPEHAPYCLGRSEHLR